MSFFPPGHITGGDFHLEPFNVSLLKSFRLLENAEAGGSKPEEHAAAYWEGTGSDSDLYAFIRFGPYASKEDFVRQWTDEKAMYAASMVYAVITTRQPRGDHAPQEGSREGAFAGVAAFQDGSSVNLSIEIGPVLVLPKFHGLGLATDIARLMAQYALKDTAHGGLGLRRVIWMANTANAASIKVAEKAGFRHEALLRWHVRYRNGRALGKIGNGKPLPPGSDPDDVARDTVILSRCWDDE